MIIFFLGIILLGMLVWAVVDDFLTKSPRQDLERKRAAAQLAIARIGLRAARVRLDLRRDAFQTRRRFDRVQRDAGEGQ